MPAANAHNPSISPVAVLSEEGERYHQKQCQNNQCDKYYFHHFPRLLFLFPAVRSSLFAFTHNTSALKFNANKVKTNP